MEFETTSPCEAWVEVSDGQRSWKQPSDGVEKRQHSIAVMGLRADREHHIHVHAIEKKTQTTTASDPLNFTTDPLPDSFPPITTTLSQPDRMEPGITLFAANLWRDSTSVLDYGYIVAVDESGDVVWYCNTGDRIADMKVLNNGHLLYQHGNYRYAYEIDLLGQDHKRWVATNLTHHPQDSSIGVEADTFHHDLLEIPNGNFLTLTTELRHFEQFPTSEFSPDAPWKPAYVVCDRVIEFDPSSGAIADELQLINLLDRRRFGYMALSGFWKDKYNYLVDDMARDWCHANALVHLDDENAIIVSFRHLDCVMKIDWTTKNIRWILGNHDGWGAAWQKYLLQPKGNVEWAYHQHSPQITPRGTLMMYDNGNYRARPFNKATMAPKNQSRVVEYRIDEQSMTVEQVFEYRGTPSDRFYCPFYCEADWLPKTNNILVTDGGHIELEDGTPHDDVPAERQWARIFEITREPSPKKVFEIKLDSGIGSIYGWSIYRANRLPNLVDGFDLVPPDPTSDGILFKREPHRRRSKALNAKY